MTKHPHPNTPQQAQIQTNSPNITPIKTEQNRTSPNSETPNSPPTAANPRRPPRISSSGPDPHAAAPISWRSALTGLGRQTHAEAVPACPTRCGSHARTLGRCSLPKCPVFRDVAPGPSRQRKRSGSWKASPPPLLSRIRSAANLSRRKSLKPGSWSWRCEIPRSDPQAAQTGLRVRAAGTGISRDMGQARYRIGRDGPRLGQQGSQAWHCAINPARFADRQARL